MQNNNATAKKLVTWAMITAIAYVVMYLSKFLPQVYGFLQFDLKDTVICLGGFVFGPLAAAAISLVVTFLEMLSASDTGPVGFLMNLVSTATFCCTASYVYRKAKGSKKGTVIGLVLAVLALTAVMLIWNYLITPLYMNQPRSDVAAMLVPVFVPFNLLKAGLNTALILLLYQPVNTALRKTGLLPPASQRSAAQSGRRVSLGVTALALVLLATCVLLALVYRGAI